MGKKNKGVPPPPMPTQMMGGTPKKPDPQQLLQKAGNLKNRFAQVKGQADQMVSDATSELVNGLLDLLGQSIQYSNAQDAKLAGYERAEETKKKVPEQVTPPSKTVVSHSKKK